MCCKRIMHHSPFPYETKSPLSPPSRGGDHCTPLLKIEMEFLLVNYTTFQNYFYHVFCKIKNQQHYKERVKQAGAELGHAQPKLG